MTTELCDLFYKYGADKCPQIFHSYSPEYYQSLHPLKNDIKNVLEIGIGTRQIMVPISGEKYEIGASLKAWRDFFPNATIYGLDIVKDVLFNEERIKCYYTDQSKSDELLKTINIISEDNQDTNFEFDLIIDDGSHIVNHMILSFNTLKNTLKKEGLYIIEDIKLKDLNIFKKLSDEYFEIIKIHEGEFEWDSFIIYRKKS